MLFQSVSMTRNNDLRNKIISEIKRIAKEQDLVKVPRSIFKRNTDISQWQIYKVFKSWNEAVTAAGLEPDTSKERKSDSDLFRELLRVCEEIKTIPTTMEFERISKFSISTYTKKRWGTWEGTLIEFRDWLEENNPKSEFIYQLPEKQKPKIDMSTMVNDQKRNFVWQSKKGIVYGPPLDFRGLRNEPVNEQGVVFLFGKISEELGFSIEAIRTNYPDCDGKRLIDKNKNLWEPVTIEFEYLSSNFLQHGHKPEYCDVIVCWIHDWVDCPLEVIELKDVIKQLSK